MLVCDENLKMWKSWREDSCRSMPEAFKKLTCTHGTFTEQLPSWDFSEGRIRIFVEDTHVRVGMLSLGDLLVSSKLDCELLAHSSSFRRIG
jgi:hypothetical protein